MKKFLIALNLVILSFIAYQATSYAQGAKHPDPEKIAASTVKEQSNCVTKDKKGNCPTPPKGDKPKPKTVEKKAEAKK